MRSILTGASRLILGLALAFAGLILPPASTPVGKQCPTAAVQQVVVVQWRKCCGKLIAVAGSRAPVPGEKEFKQCRCAERRSADTTASTTRSTGREFLVYAPIPEGWRAVPAALGREASLIPASTSRGKSRTVAPPVPPPDFI